MSRPLSASPKFSGRKLAPEETSERLRSYAGTQAIARNIISGGPVTPARARELREQWRADWERWNARHRNQPTGTRHHPEDGT